MELQPKIVLTIMLLDIQWSEQSSFLECVDAINVW